MKCEKCDLVMGNMNPLCDTMVQCPKCGEIGGDNCLGVCQCGGKYKYTTDLRSAFCLNCGKQLNPGEEKQEKKVEEESLPDFPSLASQAVSFMGTMKDFAMSGFEKVDDEEYALRIEDCRNCPFDLYDLNSGKCRDCGCFMTAKARMKVATCPKGVWKERKNSTS